MAWIVKYRHRVRLDEPPNRTYSVIMEETETVPDENAADERRKVLQRSGYCCVTIHNAGDENERT